MNPARSLGPALVSGDLHALWIYLTAPLLGAALGALAYQFVRGEQTGAASGGGRRERALRLRREQRPQRDGRAALPASSPATATRRARPAASPARRRTRRSSRRSREVGIDACDHVPRSSTHEALDWADVAVSTCSEEVCPVTPGVRRISWELPDPKSLPLEEVRPIRDEIDRRVDAARRRAR